MLPSRKLALFSLATVFAVVGLSTTAGAAGPWKTLGITPPKSLAKATLVSPVAPSTVLHLSFCLQEAKPGALKAYVDDISNPFSPHFHHYLTPAQIGVKFGPSPATVNNVINYLKSKGMKVTLQAADNMHILADATVSQAQTALNTKFNNYHSNNPNEPGNVDYISFATVPQLPSTISGYVTNIGGVQTSNKFKPATTLTPTMSRQLYGVAPLYNNGYQGQGRTIGISNWDGYDLQNLPLFIQRFGLPIPAGGAGSNVKIVTIDGGSGSGPAEGEGDLDQQMVLSSAPLANIIVYDGNGYANEALLDVLVRELNDNLCDVISESYGWYLSESDAESANFVHQEMNAQGITYMAATGDYQVAEEAIYFYPDSDPEVLLVGGTAAQTDANGNRVSEVGWDDGSGGWSPVVLPFNILPPYMQGTGVPTNINERLNPDVAGQAAGANGAGDTGAYVIYYQLGLAAFDGTSCASPTFAAGLAVAEQKLIAQGNLPNDRFGRIQDVFYRENGNPEIWYDITQGNNGTLPNGTPSFAGIGWDTNTGWGAMNWDGFVHTFVPPIIVNPASAAVYIDPTAGSEGNLPIGATSELQSIDQNYYSIQSVADPAGQVAAGQIGWIAENIGSVGSISMTVATYGPSNVSEFVYLLNAQQSTPGHPVWDMVKTAQLNNNPAAPTQVSFMVDLSKYLDSNSQITAIIRGVRPTRFGNTPYRFNIDEATITESF
jgi:subtilase family serine protease